MGLDQRVDGFTRGAGLLSVCAHTVSESLRVAQRRHGLVVALQPRPHVVGHPVPVDGACVAVAQHGQRTAVARGDDVAAALQVEGVDTLGVRPGPDKLPVHGNLHAPGLGSIVGGEILQGTVARLLLGNLLCPYRGGHQHQQQ